MQEIISKLTPDQALEIIEHLAAKGGRGCDMILKEAEKLLKSVDYEKIADEVFSELDFLDVEDLWDKSGPGRYGYTSPDEMAVEMIENELNPFYIQTDKYYDLGMHDEEKAYCKGVILGVYRFENESDSEFKDWAEDVSIECAGYLLDKWRKRTKEPLTIQEMNDFITQSCPNWAKYMVKVKTKEKKI